jgi:hypothetical protein
MAPGAGVDLRMGKIRVRLVDFEYQDRGFAYGSSSLDGSNWQERCGKNGGVQLKEASSSTREPDGAPGVETGLRLVN